MAKFADEEPQPTAAPQGETPAPTQTPQSGQPAAQCQQNVCQTTPPTTPQTPQPAKPVEQKTVCPGCKKQQDHLKYRRAFVEKGKATTDGFSHMVDFESDAESNEVIVFTCPSCNMVLFADEDDVVDFLEKSE